MKTQTFSFKNSDGVELSGKIEFPLSGKPKFFALFAHCFTCHKDLKAVHNISRSLAEEGIACLRFDFTGLGRSGGSFEDTNFSSNVEDLLSAVKSLKEKFEAPKLMIGHSLGGTAVLMASSLLEEIRAVVSIGSPANPEHVLHLIKEDIEEIRTKGSAEVTIAGRPFTIKSQFIDDLEARSLKSVLGEMRKKSLLILHSPQDTTVSIDNARELYSAAHHPKSFVSLDGADHLLTKAQDSRYVGQLIASWSTRYIDTAAPRELKSAEQIVARLDEGPFVTDIKAGNHSIVADEPESVGGSDLGPTPYDLVGSGLAACTLMTMKMYANRKLWNIRELKVHVNYNNKYVDDQKNCEDEPQARIGKFERIIEIDGDLGDAQRDKLLAIADKCPVHKTLSKGLTIETRIK